MEQELSWAAHLGLQAVVLPLPPHPEKATNYARIACQVPLIVASHAMHLTPTKKDHLTCLAA